MNTTIATSAAMITIASRTPIVTLMIWFDVDPSGRSGGKAVGSGVVALSWRVIGLAGGVGATVVAEWVGGGDKEIGIWDGNVDEDEMWRSKKKKKKKIMFETDYQQLQVIIGYKIKENFWLTNDCSDQESMPQRRFLTLTTILNIT